MTTTRFTPLADKVLDSFFGKLKAQNAERKAAVELARPALTRLIETFSHRTGQSYKIRALLYSLWNGKPTPLTEIVFLDWDLRKDLIQVMLAFGYENRQDATQFFYDAIKDAVTAAHQWAWFLEEEQTSNQ